MKKIFYFSIIFLLVLGFNKQVKAQSCDLLYFCVKYEDKEIDCSDRFYAGKLTVMAKLAKEIYFTKVIVQLDKYNPREGKFEYYNEYPFDTDPEMTYIFFPDIDFSDRGFYRVFLLDPNKNTITSSLVEII